MNKLYARPSRFQVLKRKAGMVFIKDPLRRLSALNELQDYGRMLEQPDEKLWRLHSELEDIRHDSSRNYSFYDYGSGYYYQSMEAIRVSGYRNTEERIAQLELRRLVKGRRVLDIGSNTGFLLLSLADDIESGVSIEFNPYLVKTADAVRRHKGADNVKFLTTAFEDYSGQDENFDLVLSLANHSTYDGNTKQTVDAYFGKIHDILPADGVLIFESHPPKIEPAEKLASTIDIISRWFEIQSSPKVQLTAFLDRDRTYVVARKR